jgi:hypothetical protein
LRQLFAYSVGMMVLLGEMLVEANIKVGVIEALHALPAEHLSRPIVRFLSVYDSWLALITRITFNLSVWLFWSRCVTCSFSGNETRTSSIPDNIPAALTFIASTIHDPRFSLPLWLISAL